VRREEIFEVPDVRAYAAEPFSSRRLTLRAGAAAPHPASVRRAFFAGIQPAD
jgi:hypothetical protein